MHIGTLAKKKIINTWYAIENIAKCKELVIDKLHTSKYLNSDSVKFNSDWSRYIRIDYDFIGNYGVL